MRELNLGYNKLKELSQKDSDPNGENYMLNKLFVEYMKSYISRTEVLNHLNMSGMGFSKA